MSTAWRTGAARAGAEGPRTGLSPEGPVVAKVLTVTDIAEDVREIVMTLPHGTVAWEPGAHIDIETGDQQVRQYSLCGDPDDIGTISIAVQREPEGRGGSRFMHEVRPGDDLTIHAARNTFALESAPAYRFIAGGIGITPFVPMMRAAADLGADLHLLYGGRSRARMAYAERLADTYRDRVTLWPQDRRGLPGLACFLDSAPEDSLIYVCGPNGLIEAVTEAAGSASTRVRAEWFVSAGQPVDTLGSSFIVECHRSGVEIRVPADVSIVEAVRAGGVRVMTSCQEGDCGTCQTGVLAGEPDHRDNFLTDDERESGDLMMICVSRCRGERLVLDL